MRVRAPLLLAVAVLPSCDRAAARQRRASAQPASAAEEMPRIRITDPNRDLFRLALPNVSRRRRLGHRGPGDRSAGRWRSWGCSTC